VADPRLDDLTIHLECNWDFLEIKNRTLSIATE